MSRTSTCRVFACGLIALAIAAVTAEMASAAFVGSAISIRVWNADGPGQYDLNLAIPSDPWGWEISEPLNIYSNKQPDRLVATIDSLAIHLDGDPAVNLSFAITAGASNTLVSVVSSTVTFDPLLDADAYATASISLTDNNGNGASATGMFPGSQAYQARYNGGSLFADLISPLAAAANTTYTGSDRDPLTLTEVIPGLTSSIQSQFTFMLSARDSASGTSRFQVNIPSNNIPEPSSWILAGLGSVALVLARRRFRRG